MADKWLFLSHLWPTSENGGSRIQLISRTSRAAERADWWHPGSGHPPARGATSPTIWIAHDRPALWTAMPRRHSSELIATLQALTPPRSGVSIHAANARSHTPCDSAPQRDIYDHSVPDDMCGQHNIAFAPRLSNGQTSCDNYILSWVRAGSSWRYHNVIPHCTHREPDRRIEHSISEWIGVIEAALCLTTIVITRSSCWHRRPTHRYRYGPCERQLICYGGTHPDSRSQRKNAAQRDCRARNTYPQYVVDRQRSECPSKLSLWDHACQLERIRRILREPRLGRRRWNVGKFFRRWWRWKINTGGGHWQTTPHVLPLFFFPWRLSRQCESARPPQPSSPTAIHRPRSLRPPARR